MTTNTWPELCHATRPQRGSTVTEEIKKKMGEGHLSDKC